MLNKKLYTDYLIIGGGLAGLFAAYKASQFGNVLVVTKTNSKDSNSYLAQGGIAVTLDKNDSYELHINDTLNTGRGLCNNDAVRILVEEGRERVKELIASGMQFDKEGLDYSFGMEGGHSARRIIHANGAATGEAIMNFVISKTNDIDSITVLEDSQCIEIIKDNNRVIGAYLYQKNKDILYSVKSKITIITTGGYSRLFQRSTNSNTILGEGITLAMQAGAIVKDMEFVQFHPTAFYSENGKSFLISEAVRGEGAYLLNEKLERFMLGQHKLKELAPRDIISKTIHREIQKSNIDHVYLDLRHLDAERIKARFPNIFKMAKEFLIDITTDLIPIAPAAHYSIGGIETDLNGKTNIDGLYACGEASVTGVHGANRLASNSLLECLVFSNRVVVNSLNEIENTWNNELPERNFIIDDFAFEDYKNIRNRIQNIFTKHVGIIRDEENLLKAMSQITSIKHSFVIDKNNIAGIKTNGLFDIASAIIKSALARKESRGTHQRADYPVQSDKYLGHNYIENSELKFEEYKWKLKKTI